MFIDIKEISKGGKLLSGRMTIETLNWQHGESIGVSEVSYELQLTPGERGLDLKGTMETTLALNCSRCLEPYIFPLKHIFSLNLQEIRESKGKGEYQIEEDEVDLYPLKEGKADLKEILIEQIYLNLPLKPLCDAECKGLCSVCGGNINNNGCRCPIPS
ncbi:MAG: DUF177 domain-containing protein [Acidobacteriota bacterium]